MNKPSNAISKGLVLIRNISNWPILLKDKLIAGDNILYQFRSGELVECRRQSTDINEAVVVLSGIEYPQEYADLNARSAATVFDIGANIGSFGLYINRLNKSHKQLKIYAFEPHPANAALTKSNFERNGITNYELVQKAIAATDGVQQFDISGAFDSFRLNKDAVQSIAVETITLSSFCAEKNITKIDLLKMDIEGGEYEVIVQDIEFIKGHVVKLMVEYHNISNDYGEKILIRAIEPYFSISIQHPHKGGGMLLAINQSLSK